MIIITDTLEMRKGTMANVTESSLRNYYRIIIMPINFRELGVEPTDEENEEAMLAIYRASM